MNTRFPSSGDYVKYNSNSGYINDKTLRRTPQAFSHFTFERSGHQLIVVDVQGVGDLYTDPQVVDTPLENVLIAPYFYRFSLYVAHVFNIL